MEIEHFVQKKLITLGPFKSDNINRMITTTNDFHVVIINGDFEIWSHIAADNINQWLH